MHSYKMVFPELRSLKRVHIIGVCGTLMGAFAAYLRRRGVEVTGSDQNVYPPMSDILREAGVKLMDGYRAEHISAGHRPDLVVIGNVIRSDNPEARAAIDSGLVYSSLPEAMEKLFLVDTRNLVVAGTHGKTTTSSLLSYTLDYCGKDPSYFMGGVSHDLPHSFHVANINSGNYFVLEGDEYDTAFWDKVPKFNHYLPDDVILTSIEYDHADIYPNIESVVKAFSGLLTRIRPNGRLIACLDFPLVRDLVLKSKVSTLTYASAATKEARFVPEKVRNEKGMTRFEVLDGHRVVDELAIQLPGNHNVLNALSVWIECRELGLEQEKVREAFRKFRGVKRRQEIRGEIGGVLVIDDFAHHPTAVRETLKALRARYPDRRLISVFEPRSATSRRKVFQNDYAMAFRESDLVFISAPYDQSRIAEDDQFSSEMLVSDLTHQGTPAALMETVDDGVQDVAKVSKSGDLIAVLSNGGFGGFIPKLLKALGTR